MNSQNFLIDEYQKVSSFLQDQKTNISLFPSTVISFIIVVERILKNKLFMYNKLLAFSSQKSENIDNLFGICENKSHGIDSINFNLTLNYVEKFFQELLDESEKAVLLEIYKIRNFYIHDPRTVWGEEATIDVDDICRKMGTYWQKINTIIPDVFGEIKIVKPSKIYTEDELQNIIKEDVKKLISNDNYRTISLNKYLQQVTSDTIKPTSDMVYDISSSDWSFNLLCPRCSKFALVKPNENYSSGYYGAIRPMIVGDYLFNRADLYCCKNCNLELTENQYKIAQELLKVK